MKFFHSPVGFEALSLIWSPLTLEFEASVSEMNFLDLTVFISEQDWTMPVNGRLNLRLHTKVYQKPKNLYQYLHWNSNHSRQIYFAIIKGEIVRYFRICSRKEDFEVLQRLFLDRLKRRGFPSNVIRNAFRRSPDYSKRCLYLEPSP